MFRNTSRLPYLDGIVAMAVGGALALMAPGCSPEEEIISYETPREGAMDLASDSPSSLGMVARTASTGGGAPLTCDAPESWKPVKVTGLRKAAFRAEDGDKSVEITVIDLAAAAGVLVPNVNIWRQQIKLGESTEEELKETTSSFQVAGLNGHYVELVGPEDAEPRLAILAVMVLRGPSAWFFKLKGDAELALREKERFQSFVKSAKFGGSVGGGSSMAPHGGGMPIGPHGSGMPTAPRGGFPPATTGGGISQLEYDTPTGWTPGKVGGMRKAAFRVEDGDQKVEITAIDLAAGAGALLPNVNRWRKQVKLNETTETDLKNTASPVQIGDVEGQYVELLGPEDGEKRQAILGVVAVRERKAWFFKMTGDVELALREKERFQSFVKSVKFTATESPAKEAPAKEAPTKEEVTVEGTDNDE